MEAQKLIYLTGINSGLTEKTPATHSFGEFLLHQQLLSSEIDSGVEKIVCIDYSSSLAAEIKKLGLDHKDCTLIRMEPSVVLPANFALSRQNEFGNVITVGGCDSRDSISVPWPLVLPSVAALEKLRNTERVNRVVVINGNKMSFIKGELYSLRRKAIKAVSNLDLYGTQWDSKLAPRLIIAAKSLAQAILSLKIPRPSGLTLWFQNYPKSKGPVADKLATMAHYKYALVLENSAEYMSEKLMESLFAGCIPVYVGPDPETFGIPKDLVIRAQPNLRSIQEGLAVAENWNIDQFHSKLRVFLSSSEVRDFWDHKRVFEQILEEVQTAN